MKKSKKKFFSRMKKHSQKHGDCLCEIKIANSKHRKGLSPSSPRQE